MAGSENSVGTHQGGGRGASGGPGVVNGAGPAPVARQRSSAGTGAMVLAVTAYVALVAGAMGLVMAGAGSFGFTPQLGVQIAGYIGLFLFLASAPIAWMMGRSSRLSANQDRMLRSLETLTESVRALHESSGLSDDARRVINRRGERDLLCRAIEEDIQRQDWDAAMVLCAELADRFGYRAEAEEFRSRIEQARSEIMQHRLNDAIARLDGLIVQRRWDVAINEAGRIRRLYPDSPRTENLRQRVEQARLVFKDDLERRFLDAANTDRIDDAMGLLRELDGYLSEAEGAQFREVARGVIGKARENLGAQFRIAVQDRRWATAAALGRRIITDFPNTRMAQEIRGMMDSILARANTSEEVAGARG